MLSSRTIRALRFSEVHQYHMQTHKHISALHNYWSISGHLQLWRGMKVALQWALTSSVLRVRFDAIVYTKNKNLGLIFGLFCLPPIYLCGDSKETFTGSVLLILLLILSSPSPPPHSVGAHTKILLLQSLFVCLCLNSVYFPPVFIYPRRHTLENFPL